MLKINNYAIDKLNNDDIEFKVINAKNDIVLYLHNGNMIKLKCYSTNTNFNGVYIDQFFNACIELNLKQICYLLF